MKIILGSQSEGRKKVLKAMGYEFEVMPANIDEKAVRFDDPVMLTLELANRKADALAQRLKPPALLITADLVAISKGQIQEKPLSDKEALEMLTSLSGGHVETVTSVVVMDLETGFRAYNYDIASIYFKQIPGEVIDRYVRSGDPFYHAGAFDHEHPLLAPYVEKIEGEPESITGLPKTMTQQMIQSVLKYTGKKGVKS